MSHNQSREDKSEAQLRKPGRSGTFSQQKGFAGGAGKGAGGGTAPPSASNPSNPSFSTNRSSKKSSNVQGGQSRAGPTSTNSEPNVAVAAPRVVQNGAHAKSQLQGFVCVSDPPASGTAKPVDSSVSRSSRALPKAPSSQSTSGASNSPLPTTPSKDMSRSFPFQFGTISPGFMNGMQIPARTSSAPPNLDEQKRDQARNDSFRAIPTMPVPSAPKPQQPKKDVGRTKQPNTAETHPPSQARRDVQVQMPAAPTATTTQKSSVIPSSGVTVSVAHQQTQIPLQYGGPSPPIQSQSVTASSLQTPMPLHVGNVNQVQQQVFVPGLQSHPLQPQGMMHQGRSLGFAPQMSHQLGHQLGNLGLGMAPQFSPQQAGTFGIPRKIVKITDPNTHEELKLDKRTDAYADVSSSGPRSHPNVPPQSQPIQSFSPAHPINYYTTIQPNSYNPLYFPNPTSLPLTSTQMAPGSSAARYNYQVGQGGTPVSFMNPSLNPLPSSNAGPPIQSVNEAANLEHARDSYVTPISAPSASVRVTVKPAVASVTEKVVSSVTVSPPVSKSDSTKLLRQPLEASHSNQQTESRIGLNNSLQQPKSVSESPDSIPLPVTVKISAPTSASVSMFGPQSSPSVTITPTEESASVVTNTEGRRRESVRSDSLKDKQRKPAKKELRHSQQQHQADASDAAANLKSPLLKPSRDDISSDLNASQVSKTADSVHPSLQRTREGNTALGMPSRSLDSDGSSLRGTEEVKARSSASEPSEGMLQATKEVLQDVHAGGFDKPTMANIVQDGEGAPCEPSSTFGLVAEEISSEKLDFSHLKKQLKQDTCDKPTMANIVQDGEGAPCEPSSTFGLVAEEISCEKLNFSHLKKQLKQDTYSSLEAGSKQETVVATAHITTQISAWASQNCSNSEVQTRSTISESSESGKQTELVSKYAAISGDVAETNVVSECSSSEANLIGMNAEAESSSDVGRTVDKFASYAQSSDSYDGKAGPSGQISSRGALEYENLSVDVSKTGSEKNTSTQEAAVVESSIVGHESAAAPPFVSETTLKREGRVTENTCGGQTSTSLLVSKDKISMEQSRAKSISAKKKKRKEILMKADAAGITSDLYMAYKSPEEKHEISVSTECMDSSAADVKHGSVGGTERENVIAEDDGQNKVEVDDWEDAAEIPTPKLKISENGELIPSASKQDVEYEGGVMGKKKYTRDFLLTLSEQCNVLPAAFEIESNIVDTLMSSPVPPSHIVDRVSIASSGRIIDRPTGGSRLDRRGIVDDDKWIKSPGSFATGRDPRLDVTHGGASVNFRPGQAGNHGVRNPRGQSSSQYVGGILPGPMQALTSPGAMPRSSPDADRWQRAFGSQKGLIPSPQTPLQVMHKAEKKYEVGKVSDKEVAKQRQLKGILNKLTPQNFDRLFEKVKEVNIDNAVTLTGVISQIFDKALTEPTFCEMYADFCDHLARALPDFSEDNEKITFKRLLLNKCQEEFERGEREQAEANIVEEEGEIKQSNEGREEKKIQARRRMLGNIRLIGELYKKKMLTERIMHECIKKLLGQYQNPDEEDIEALCKLMSTIGEMIDHPKAKEHMDAYFEIMQNLSWNQKLSSRVRFMLKDAIDLRKNKWQQRRKVEGPKKIEEVHRDAAQERQLQTSRLSRGGSAISSARRGQPIDYGPRVPTALSSQNPLQMGGPRSLAPQVRGFGTQDVRLEDRRSSDSRLLSVPLPQRPIDDDTITLGPQGGLARGMSFRGPPLMPSVAMADVSPTTGDPRRMQSSQNGYSTASDWTPYNSREEFIPRFTPDRFTAAPYDQSNALERNASFGNRDLRNADRSFDRSMSRSPAIGHVHGSSGGTNNASFVSKVPEERLRDMSIAAIREYYSARNEEEVHLCIKDLNSPSFYPNMVMLWVTDSFERNDIDRDLLAKLLVNLCKSDDSLLSQVQLIKGFEGVFSTLEDAVTDSPKAAEYLGRILGKVISENVVPLKEIGRIIHEGGEEPGFLVQSGLASDVLGSIFESIEQDKGEIILNVIRTSSNLRLEDFKPPDPIKPSKLDAFI